MLKSVIREMIKIHYYYIVISEMKYLLCLLWGAAVRYIISKYRERRVIDSYKFEYIHFFLMPIRRAMVCSF